MTSQSAPNYVHVDENWRQRVRMEHLKANSFQSDWGFLSSSEPASHALDRPHATSPIKYFNTRGGTWTVQEKRVPLFGTAEAAKALPLEDIATKHSGLLVHVSSVPNRHGSPVRYGPPSRRTADAAAVVSHSLRSSHIRQSNPVFHTTTGRYGSRLPLEMFGVADHGHKALRTKEPSN